MSIIVRILFIVSLFAVFSKILTATQSADLTMGIISLTLGAILVAIFVSFEHENKYIKEPSLNNQLSMIFLFSLFIIAVMFELFLLCFFVFVLLIAIKEKDRKINKHEDKLNYYINIKVPGAIHFLKKLDIVFGHVVVEGHFHDSQYKIGFKDFKYLIKTPKKANLSELNYEVVEDTILITIPKITTKNNVDKDNLDLTQFLLPIPLILFVISLPIFGLSFINLFVFYVTTIMAIFFSYIIKKETIEGNLFKESNENIFVDADIKINELALINEKFNEKVLFLNKLIEESFFEGSTIKEQLKKDINELIFEYIKLHKQDNLMFELTKTHIDSIQQQKVLIEEAINEVSIAIISNSVTNLDIDKNIRDIKDNVSLYFNEIKTKKEIL